MVAGLTCVVVGCVESLADDLAVYLEDANARVERVSTLDAAKQRGAGTNSLIVWVIDIGHEPQLPETMRAAAHAQIGQGARIVCVLIGHGKRHRPRVIAPDLIVVDGNALGRKPFLRAVAAAAGRASLDTDSEALSVGRVAATALSREEARRRGRLILVVEDNETNQKVILRQLALFGHAADVTTNGMEALNSWRNEAYALVLTDLHMPAMDGYELTKAIRAEEKNSSRVPIIALTANALKDEAERCRAAGMDDYLSKPMPLAQLKSMLDKWLPASPLDAVIPTEAEPTDSLGSSALVAAPVDVRVLKELVGDDPDTVREFLQDFHHTAAKIAAELRTSCDAKEVDAVVASAHKLKSAAYAVGASALGNLCEAIEDAGKGQGSVCDALATLEPRFEAELAAVEAYLAKL